MIPKIALHIIQDLDVAGAQTVVMNYLRWLHNDLEIEIRVAVLGCNKHSAYSEECEAMGFYAEYYDYTPWTRMPIVRSIINWLKLNLIVRRAIKRNKPDVIHSHQTSIIPNICLPFLFSGIRGRYHTLHSDPYAITNRHALWARFAFNYCGIKPVCVTRQQAEKAVKRYGIKYYDIIRNGLDETAYKTEVNVKVIKSELGISEKDFIIGCVSRFSKIKNFDFMLKIFAACYKMHQDAILLLVGDGEEKGHIKSLAKELGITNRLVMTGQRKDVVRLYKVMDVFILTSLFESSSIVTVEAQLAGTRCVVADSIPGDAVITTNVNRISLDAPTETWIKGIEGTLPFEKKVYPSSQFTKEGVIEALKKLYAHNM